MKNACMSNDLPMFLFHQGTTCRAYEFLGCHYFDERPTIFRTWAPNAIAVNVVGDFNSWNENTHPMRRVSAGGVWEVEIAEVQKGEKYKFSITTSSGKRILKSDPYAFYSESGINNASIVYDIEGYEWNDEKWIKNRENSSIYERPVNIYEMNLGSWKRDADGGHLSYKEAVEQIITYVLDMGYTHIELMPIMEYPYDGSWGYQICGYYAATSRFGTPHDLMYFIDKCHQAGIGVILDWVPSHFPKDAHGLYEYDGRPLYECQGADRMEMREWGTRCFDFGRTEVQSFLVSNAIFWLDMFHADGLRVDAVSSMLYLDYSKGHGEWTPNIYGNNENLESIAFLQKLNTVAFGIYSGIMMIAEESTAWPKVTKPVHHGGLGFNFKWNMGWMNDMLEYTSVDPFYRKNIHEKITFSFYYAFSENFILAISHDEVVHGKKSLIDKMPGDYETKFAGLRAFLGYMMTHPGKKLNFMGTELGQFKEWDESTSIDWDLLQFPMHQKLNNYVKKLNHFYKESPALWQIDSSWDGFKWISENDNEHNIIIFIRMDKKGNELIIVQNFAPIVREGYCFGVPSEGEYKEIFNSDNEEFGGWGHGNKGVITTESTHMHGYAQRVNITIPPMSTIILKQTQKAVKKPAKPKSEKKKKN